MVFHRLCRKATHLFANWMVLRIIKYPKYSICVRIYMEPPGPHAAVNCQGGPAIIRKHLDWTCWSLLRWLSSTCLQIELAQSIMGRMNWRYTINLFLMDTSLRLLRGGLSIPRLWEALRLTWSMLQDKVSLLSKMTPRYLTFSVNWTSSLRNVSGRGGGICPVVLTVILQSRSHISRSAR